LIAVLEIETSCQMNLKTKIFNNRYFFRTFGLLAPNDFKIIYRFSFSCRELRYFSTHESQNIVTHMDNWRRICFSHYLARTLFQNLKLLRLKLMRGKVRDILIL